VTSPVSIHIEFEYADDESCNVFAQIDDGPRLVHDADRGWIKEEHCDGNASFWPSAKSALFTVTQELMDMVIE